MNRLLWIALLALAVGTGMLRRPDVAPRPASDDTDVFQRRWEALNISHYRYSLIVVCECGLTHQPYTMEVRDGQLISAVDDQQQPISEADIDAPPHSVDWFYGLTTMDSLFHHLEKVSAQASAVNVVYDPQYAFPAYAFVTWQPGRPAAEVALHILNFQVLP
jgi:hypothetical protein